MPLINDKARKLYQRNWAREAARKRRKKGLCSSCKRKALKGHVHCKKHLEASRLRSRERRSNPKLRAAERARGREYYRDLRKKILDKYGRKCANCGYDKHEEALQLDHVNGGGRKERKRLRLDGVYRKALEDTKGNYQILCANCNVLKRTRKEGGRYGRAII